jgi:hypothetical protein
MPANLTPQYQAADARYRAAQTAEEQLAALEEMWRELPKHKGTEKMQAELKKKLSALKREVQAGAHRHSGAGKADPYAIPKTGAAQFALLGPPNSGKSSIVGSLTHAHVRIADYPFSTELPVPGMATFEDIQIQLIDTPPVTAEHVPTGASGLWHSAEGLIIVGDLAAESCVEDVDVCLRLLADRRIELTAGPRECPREAGAMLKQPGLVFACKADAPEAADNLALLRAFVGDRVRIEPLSVRQPASLARVPRLLFELAHVIRVYAKPPGRKPDLDEPFVVPAGSDLHAVARRIFGGREVKVHAARIWGAGVADGQHVQMEHVLRDKDIVELHT